MPDDSTRSLQALSKSVTKELDNIKHELSALDSQQHIIAVHRYATEVFEDSDIAWDWLKSPNRALGGAIPLQLLETAEGTEQVETILGRIDYGVYS
jgi:putative toxin-antitoxin system antitoxin component (TIGR02293 family)